MVNKTKRKVKTRNTRKLENRRIKIRGGSGFPSARKHESFSEAGRKALARNHESFSKAGRKASARNHRSFSEAGINALARNRASFSEERRKAVAQIDNDTYYKRITTPIQPINYNALKHKFIKTFNDNDNDNDNYQRAKRWGLGKAQEPQREDYTSNKDYLTAYVEFHRPTTNPFYTGGNGSGTTIINRITTIPE